jgi:hypothetical protein
VGSGRAEYVQQQVQAGNQIQIQGPRSGVVVDCGCGRLRGRAIDLPGCVGERVEGRRKKKQDVTDLGR